MIGWAMGAGMLVGAGGFLLYAGLRRGPAALADALASLDGTLAASHPDVEPPPSTTAVERVGWWLHTHLKLPLTAHQRQVLLMHDRSVADFFVERLVLTFAGFFLPLLWVAMQAALGQPVGWMPMVASLAGAAAGYWFAGARLASNAVSIRRAAVESLHTFFDLVALERLANQSATQSVAAAAEISDAPLFRRIAAAVERSRMEQRPPWDELRRIGASWQLPELVDFADVMQLEEQGAALADVLQARVRELRDAHLAQQRAQAQEDTEKLSIWMTIPALLLGAAFIIPPLLQLTGL